MIGYSIQIPHCGRDKYGLFHCRCGRCYPLPERLKEKTEKEEENQ